MKRLLLIALTLLAFSCGGTRNYDASQSLQLKQGANPSVDGYSLAVMSVTDGLIKLSVTNDETKEQEEITLRKGQELVLAAALEALLSKRRILEIYLNNVEWGEGVFGAEAAAQHYFNKPATRLSANEAARLAVMLPSPKFFEKRPGSPYVSGRASTIQARMSAVDLP